MSELHANPAILPNADESLGRSMSGRWFVIGAALTIALIWAIVFAVFREWRARHRELAAFGAREVAPLVDPLAAMVPPNVEPRRWRNAVASTRGMLVAATASGTIDRDEMQRLRDALVARFARDTPATVADDLAALWDQMGQRVGPIITGQPSRPPFCPPRPLLLGGSKN